MTDQTYYLPHAHIEWRQETSGSQLVPYSPDYGDIYWSRAGEARQEKDIVFIQGNHLPTRFAALGNHDHFTLLELGFGFGVNFELTVEAWRKASLPSTARLHYISYEKHPVKLDDLKRIASDELVAMYPDPIAGAHHIELTGGITLTLVFGDALAHLKLSSMAIDAVYLDGFSPSKNDALWQAELINEISQRLKSGATLASYSVAGHLRRKLNERGIETNKVPGFGNKAERLEATKPGDWQKTHSPPLRVAVIGAGISGLFTARALQRRGHRVTVFEASEQPLGAVKSVSQLGVYPRLSAQVQPASLFSLRAFSFFTRQYEIHKTGRIHFPHNEKEIARYKKLAALVPDELMRLVSPAEASALADIRIDEPGVYYPTAGWFDAQVVTEGLDIRTGVQTAPEQKDQEWLVANERFDVVLLNTGNISNNWLAPLPLKPIRGQALSIRTEHSPKVILSREQAWFPVHDSGFSVFSGTYDLGEDHTEARDQDTEELLGNLSRWSTESPEFKPMVGVRTSTPDRMPIVGPVPDWKALDDSLERSAQPVATASPDIPGLFCAVGFGSHGVTNGPLCADYLARLVSQEPITSDHGFMSPRRFKLRKARIKRPRKKS